MSSNLTLSEARVIDDTVSIDLYYPRCEGAVKALLVGLVDVRAADSIRISYDFERDGWKIEQASIFEWPAEETVFDQDWKEVAFIRAWQREEERKDD